MQKINLIKNTIFYIFVFLFACFFIKILIIKNTFHGYVFQEWLVNYSQGFVRRGLTGTFFLFIQKKYNADIDKIIKYFSYITFFLFSIIYIFKVRQCKKILDWQALMVVLFLPSLILFPIYNSGVIGRKEFFFFFGLLINLFFLEKTIRIWKIDRDIENSFENYPISVEAVNKYCYNLFIWYNLLSIPTALSHEGIIFLGLPLNMVITSSFLSLTLSKKQVSLQTIIIYLPTILVSFLCLMFKGNNTIALGICHSWQEYSHIYSSLPKDCSNIMSGGVLRYIAISNKDIIGEVMSTNISQGKGSAFFSWIFAFFMNIVILMRTSSTIIINSVTSLNRKIAQQGGGHFLSPVNIVTHFSFKYAFIPFIFSFILYVIALDWGRWFFITSVSYVFCLLSPNLIYLEIVRYHHNQGRKKYLFPIFSTYSKFINYLYNLDLLRHFSIIYFLGLFYTLFVLKLHYYNMSVKELYTNPLTYSLWQRAISFLFN